jgi:hypothetical protein
MKEYLGDGVYVEFTGYSIVLTAENGIQINSTIHLDSETLFNLNEFAKKVEF